MISLICGSGFGLYGYLPAIYKFSKKIYLSEEYKKILHHRKELAKFHSKIIWYKNINEIIKKIDYFIIAKRPADQFKIIKKILENKNKIKHFFIEKPISSDPKKSIDILNILHNKKKKYSIGFLFKYLKWYNLIKKKLSHKKKQKIFFRWNIKKNMTAKTSSWKYFEKMGGGIIRYWGIHFIKLFQDLNFSQIKYNKMCKNYWEILIIDKNKNSIKLIIKYSNSNSYYYKINKNKRHYSENPFLIKIDPKQIDPRCFYLKKYINENLIEYQNNFKNDKNFINLWEKIELTSKCH